MPNREEASRESAELSPSLSGSKTPGKGSRRKSREAALQALFLAEMHPATPFEQSLEAYTDNFPVKTGSQSHFYRLVRGVWEEKETIDRLIKTSAEHWRIERMSGVDRNILRLAVFELIHCPDIPPRVAINEAIDLGKQYGSEESGAFVNGILDRIFLEQSGKAGSKTELEEGL